MVKFIIEVDDEYIRERSNVDFFQKQAIEEGKDANLARLFLNMVGFHGINDKIEKGKTEFQISRDMLSDGMQEFFDRNFSDVLIMAIFASRKEKS